MSRRNTLAVQAGSLTIGNAAPVSVQTMWDRSLATPDTALFSEISSLKQAGCDIIRFSVPDEQTLSRLGSVIERSVLPVVADIHFDYRLAIGSMKAGAHKVRINPGNIGAEWKVREVVKAAGDAGCAIRIGLNGGSLPRILRSEPDRAKAMLSTLEEYLNLFESLDFTQTVVSMKDSDPEITVRACREYAERFQYPLHLGVTEAGPLIPAVTKSAFYLGSLLQDGIGDTLRISITGSLIDEVRAGVELLKMLGLRKSGVRLVSCPKCGRSGFDTHWFCRETASLLESIDTEISVAVMGCAVNGPGEAAHADLGITGIGREICIFRNGEITVRTDPESCIERFSEELKKVLHEKADH